MLSHRGLKWHAHVKQRVSTELFYTRTRDSSMFISRYSWRAGMDPWPRKMRCAS